jgi:hypothetical protein
MGKFNFSKSKKAKAVIKAAKSQAKVEVDKTLEDKKYQIGTVKQASYYDKKTKYHINHMRQKISNATSILNALVEYEDYNIEDQLPKLTKSVAKEKQDRTDENHERRLLYQAELTSYLATKKEHVMAVDQVYSYLWSQCYSNLRNKIEQLKDYKSVIVGKPAELLKAIRRFSVDIHPRRVKQAVITETILAYLTTKQKENESLNDYSNRFLSARAIMIEALGRTPD